MTNLVLSWCNFKWNKSKVFIKSLRGTGYKGDIVFVEGTQDEDTLAKYKEHNVTVLSCEAGNKHIIEKIFAFLISNEEKYDKVILSDSRDVVFQYNPFECFKDKELHLTTEDLKIKDQPLNSFWIKQEFGADVLEKIGDGIIINAGITYGGIASAINWVEKCLIYSPKVEQAILNYVFRMGKLTAVVEPNDGSSLVWTIGTKIDTEKDDFYKFYGDHFIMTNNHYIPTIIHQYDRHPKIKEMLENYYADR
jgi:hypothetical protein